MNILDVLNNKTQYPDDTKFVLPGGEETTIGALRQQFSDGFVPKGDFTKVTQQHSQRQQQLEAQLTQAQQQLAAAIRGDGGKVNLHANDPWAMYRDDPAFAPFVKAIDSLESQVKTLSQRTQQHEQTWWTQQHLNVIRDLQKDDESLRTQEGVQKLLAFAQQRGYANLKDAYDLMTRDDVVKRARDEGKKEGIEEGKKLAKAPVLPNGSRNAPKQSEIVPFDSPDLEVKAMNDPEIQAALAGESA